MESTGVPEVLSQTDTPDELKSIPKGSFIVMKTGTHPMQTQLRLLLQWGITFGAPYTVPERANREVAYANRMDLEQNLPQSNKFVGQNATWNQTAVKRKSSRTTAFGDDGI